MILEEWRQLCAKACENDYDYLQKDRFAKLGEVRYTFGNCIITNYTECTPEMKLFD